MSRLRIPRAPSPNRDDCAPGQWYPVQRDGGGTTANICCPECGRFSHLRHQIAEDGSVSPSVVCPYTEDCGWHVFVILEGWKP